MEKFFGSWKLLEKENFDEYLTAIGEISLQWYFLYEAVIK